MTESSGTAGHAHASRFLSFASGSVAITLAVAALLVTGCDGGPTDPGDGDPKVIVLAAPPPDGATAAASITAADLEQIVGVIAHDSMLGRATPSPELEEVAWWAANEFASYGLEPAGEDGFLQWYFARQEDTDEAVNVIARLEGSDPAMANQYVVIGAHYDHVGVRLPIAGDSIYNGADDNGSGTAAVMELAEAFASLEQAPPRSMIFVLFSGEERGLLGSHHYVSSVVSPVGSTVAMINLDMIGRNRTDQVGAVYQASSDIFERADTIAGIHADLNMDVVTDPWPEDNLLNRGDQAAFIPYGIPVLLLTSGLHEDYHRPSDEADRLDYEKTARLVRLVFWIGWEFAANSQPPGFTQ